MRPPLRLLHIVDSLQPGGMENILVQLLNRLDPERFQSEVCCLSQSGPFAQRLNCSVKVHVLQKPPGFQWSAVKQLRQLMRQGRFDVVHTRHLGGLIYSVLARETARLALPKIVHSEHILWDQAEVHWKRRWQRRLLYHFATCIFTVSHRQLQQMQELGQQHPWQMTLLNGVDADRFHSPALSKRQIKERLGLDPEGFWVGKVARFGATKRHLDLIAAFEAALPKAPLLRLLLVGDEGLEKDAVLQRIASSPARDKIHWAGFQQDPVPWYHAMDALVVASSFEGLPNAVLEGMACGLPLLANDVCGVRELAEHGVHGWIEDLSTVDRLSVGLQQIAHQSPSLLHAFGQAGQQHVQANFSIEAMVLRYEDLYQRAASINQAPA